MFRGLQIGLTRQETLNSTIGELLDLSSCLSICNGEEKEKKKLTYEEAMALR